MEKRCDKNYVRPNIALLIDNLFDKYCQNIWKSVFEAAEEYDINMVGFVGGSLSPYRYGKAIYDLIDPRFFDGIIIVTGSLVWGSTKEELEAFCKRFLPIPMVSISAPVRGLTNILVDNDKGMRQLIEHMIKVHHYQRIAFINGPKDNNDAAARFDSYQRTLEKYGIPYDSNLVVDGEMDRESGARAIQTLLDERKVVFDAIVGANDNMTLYAMQELQWRGIKVPEEVGVGGFDDIGENLTCYPTLTTVRQPFREMGYEAVRSMRMLLEGKSVDEYQYLPAEIVIRGSCGCNILQEFSNLILENDSAAFSHEIPSVDDLVTAVKIKFPQQVIRVKNKAIIQEMAQALIDEVIKKDQGRFLRVLVKVIADERLNGINTALLLRIVSAMVDQLPINGADGERQVIINRIIKDSFALMGMVAEEIQSYYRFKYESGNIIINRRFPHTILLEENAVEKLILEDYVRLGIDSFYLMQYCDNSRKKSILKYHFDQSTHITIDPETSSFPSNRLIPGHFIKDGERYSYIVLPVHFKEDQFGYYLCQNNKLDPFFYETIANQLGMAIKVTTLIQEVNRYANDLEKRVLERTKELKEAQQQLVETAHKAGMAEIAVGVVHNVGNLLNSINVATACISNIVRCSKIDNLRKANEIFKSNQEEISRDLPGESKVRLLPNYYESIGNA
ncbi:MAG TPA: substrate-binding domain-containing protein, partial [Bacillota bacterium]|nr:substrate-binding domain-containing protein [Bacillota bacterium]